ncbi:hypothetical protein [Butyrivibrio sp. FCS014]|uniref:hypothetical protein n=1 Tax=Butyrivibrio sp. FCS014 TaxID=1408304 RepID=UPI0004675384|nr:hypothetical protein [Butyrivibrio sp. FCS014]
MSAYDRKEYITKIYTGSHIFEFMTYGTQIRSWELLITGGSKEIKTELEKKIPDYDRIELLAEKSGQTMLQRIIRFLIETYCHQVRDELNKKTSLIVEYEPIKKR